MKRRVVKITEAELIGLISECVDKILGERIHPNSYYRLRRNISSYEIYCTIEVGNVYVEDVALDVDVRPGDEGFEINEVSISPNNEIPQDDLEMVQNVLDQWVDEHEDEIYEKVSQEMENEYDHEIGRRDDYADMSQRDLR